MNYRLADMLALIRNGQQANLAVVKCQASKLLGNVLEVLCTRATSTATRKPKRPTRRFSKSSSNITKAKA